MGRTPQPLSREREARIFDAAAQAFLTQGYEASSLNRIIEAAGMPKSSFYHYFADKNDLRDRMFRCVTSAVAEYIRPPDLAALAAPTYWSAMFALVDDLGAMAHERPETIAVSRMLYSSSPIADETAARLREAVRRWCDEALARGVELGVVRSDLPLSLLGDIAIVVLVAIDRWALAAAAGADAATSDRALTALRQLLEGSSEWPMSSSAR